MAVDRPSEPRDLGRLSGPPLILQLIALLVGALVAAQLVTLLLTLVLPPAPPREYRLADIAAALAGPGRDDDRFDRVEQSGPPDLTVRGWFVSETSSAKLAGLLGRPIPEVALGFYTQLPVGGGVEAVAAPGRLPGDAVREPPPVIGALAPQPTAPLMADDVEVAFSGGEGSARLMDAALIQQMPGGPPGGGFPGGGPPGGGFPGAGLPGGGFPQSLPRPPQPMQLPRPPQPQVQPPAPRQAQASPPTLAHVPSDPPVRATTAQPSPQPSSPRPAAASSTGSSPGVVGGAGVRDHVGAADFPGGPGAGANGERDAAGGPPDTQMPPATPALLPLSTRRPSAPVRALATASRRAAAADPASVATPAREAASPITPTAGSAPAASPAAAAPERRADAPGDRRVDRLASVAPVGRPVRVARPATGLFGFAPAPFVEGDFVAGVRLADGRWAVVSPHAEGFPNVWQRRVALWFLLSLLAVAPVAWLFARRIVGPLNDFAHAAAVLGRDPGAAVLPLDGPAEIGRAAHAFNQMQSRLRSFVDDRTAMIGAISHDLRTPLTRLRFRIEDVPEDQQDALRDEVAEMEAMISSVIGFMRDAAIPNARERRDLAEIVDDVVEDATLLGDVRTERVESAIVDVDPLGIRRVLDNLLTNAIKYGGGNARVALRVEFDRAVADIVDSGPGVPDGELERIFEPFYRSEAARRSGREGSGLGLAVCRSIARAHGGDVSLFRSPQGFTARVTLPLAYADGRRAA